MGATSIASKLNALTVRDTSTLDITDQALIIDYTGTSPLATIRQYIFSGRGGAGLGATWAGTGIASSTVADWNAAHPEERSVGYAENSQLPLGAYGTFRNVAVDNTSILIAYTRTGDINLDGVVNDDDVTVIGFFYAPTTPNDRWAQGDIDFDGFVENDDVTLVNAFFNSSAQPI
jgi:hypothetical protein